MRLSEIPSNVPARIVSIEKTSLVPVLSGLGITEGARIVRLFSAPSGDPSAYWVRGTVTAIRRSEADGITVKEEGR